MGELPTVIAKSNHFASAVARAPDQPTVIERVPCFRGLVTAPTILREIIRPYFDCCFHLSAITLYPLYPVLESFANHCKKLRRNRGVTFPLYGWASGISYITRLLTNLHYKLKKNADPFLNISLLSKTIRGRERWDLPCFGLSIQGSLETLPR